MSKHSVKVHLYDVSKSWIQGGASWKPAACGTPVAKASNAKQLEPSCKKCLAIRAKAGVK